MFFPLLGKEWGKWILSWRGTEWNGGERAVLTIIVSLSTVLTPFHSPKK